MKVSHSRKIKEKSQKSTLGALRVTPKKLTSEDIAKHTAEFLARGRKPMYCPPGLSGIKPEEPYKNGLRK